MPRDTNLPRILLELLQETGWMQIEQGGGWRHGQVALHYAMMFDHTCSCLFCIVMQMLNPISHHCKQQDGRVNVECTLLKTIHTLKEDVIIAQDFEQVPTFAHLQQDNKCS